MLMEFDTRLVRYTDEQSRVFYRSVTDRAAALSGVRSVALGQAVPMTPTQSSQTVIPEGYQFPKGQDTVSSLSSIVDEHYFDTMKMPILRGRAFTAADKADSKPVAIVNEAFAQKYWPNQDAVGKRLRLKDRKAALAEVVGVTKTSRYIFISEPPFPFVYLPYAQNFSSRMSLFVETAGDPAEIATPLRVVVRSLDANIPIYNARTMANLYQQRTVVVLMMILQLVSALGLLGLALALIGLYGLIAYSVSRRTQEIGIRMALGAHRSDVLKMVLRHGFVLSIIGIAIGLAASIALRPVLAAGLIGIGSTNPIVLLIVPLALILVTIAACYLPARRASQVDPIRALRWE